MLSILLSTSQGVPAHTLYCLPVISLPVTLTVALVDMVIALPHVLELLRLLQRLFLQILLLYRVQILLVAVAIARTSIQSHLQCFSKLVSLATSPSPLFATKPRLFQATSILATPTSRVCNFESK